MVRTRHVIAQRFGCVPAEEDRTGIADLGRQGIGIVDGQFQMFGRQPVDQFDRLVQVAHRDDGPEPAPAFARDLGPRQCVEVSIDGLHDSVGEFLVVGYQDRLCRWVVLGLGQQIGGDPPGVVGAVGEDQDFRRAGNHVNAHGAEHLALGRGDVGVSGADDFIDGRDGGGSIGQGADGLSATDAINFVDAGDPGGGQNQGAQGARRRRDHHGKAVHSRHTCRQGVHQDRGRIGCRASRYVKTDRRDRRPAVSQSQSRVVHVVQVVRTLARMEIGHPLGHQFEGPQDIRRTGGDGLVDLVGRHPHGLGCQGQLVEAPRVGNHGLVALVAHLGKYGADHLVDVGINLALGDQEGGEGRLEIRVLRIQSLRHR